MGIGQRHQYYTDEAVKGTNLKTGIFGPDNEDDVPSHYSTNLYECECLNSEDATYGQRKESYARYQQNVGGTLIGSWSSPLILERIVALATLVYPSAAFNDQLATNHNKQNHAASRAVSSTVSGARSPSATRRTGSREVGRLYKDMFHYFYRVRNTMLLTEGVRASLAVGSVTSG